MSGHVAIEVPLSKEETIAEVTLEGLIGLRFEVFGYVASEAPPFKVRPIAEMTLQRLTVLRFTEVLFEVSRQ